MRAEADLESCTCHEHPALSLLLATYCGKGPPRVGGRTRQPGIQLIAETHGPGTGCQEPGVIANLLSTRQSGLARSPQDAWYVNYGTVVTSLTVIAAGALYIVAARPYPEKT
jgi:hypothetical protein